MKVDEILLSREALYEISLKNAVAAGALGAGLMFGHPTTIQHEPQVTHVMPAPKPDGKKREHMTQLIVHRYDLDAKFAQRVVDLAMKYEKPGFPRAPDILAIVGIESSFDPDAVSGLRHDPAVGLMQVRPGVWNLNRHSLAHNIEKQIATGADILHLYYTKLKSRDAAVAAYNVGMGEYRSGNTANGYVSKYTNERRQYKGM